MILAHKSGLPSAKLLRDSICKELGWDKKKLLVTTDPTKIKRLHLRYGSSSPIMARVEKGIPNSKSFIQLCTDKKYISHQLKKSVKIISPNFNSLSSSLPSKNDFPFLIRETLRGSGSEGIVIFQKYEEFLTALAEQRITYSSYWTPYYDFKEEFRVHVLGGKIGKIFRKQINEDEKVDGIFIRNNDNSHFYRIKLEKTPENVVEVTQKFGEFISSQYGKEPYFTALDLGVTSKKEVVFIEANSAPGLNQATAEIYAKYLIASCPVFAQTEEDMKVAKELQDQTTKMKIDWAFQI